MESHGGMVLTGENRRTQRKTCRNATLCITNPIWTDAGANPDLRGERPATNSLSHGMNILRQPVTFAKDCYKAYVINPSC
jgi:hypothetical protein